MMKVQREVQSIFGTYKRGYLHGDAREFQEQCERTGRQVALQGPEWSNRNSDIVTVLYRSANAAPGSGWSVWGRTMIHEKPDEGYIAESEVPCEYDEDACLAGL